MRLECSAGMMAGSQQGNVPMLTRSGFALALTAIGTIAQAAVPPEHRVRFVSGFEKSCIGAANNRTTQAQAQAYCRCAAEKTADALTPEEFWAAERGEEMSPAMKEKLRQAGADCETTIDGPSR